MAQSPDYKDYNAKTLDTGAEQPASGRAKLIPTKFLYDTLLLPYALMRHRRTLSKSERLNDHTYTCFLRAPSQLNLLTDEILGFLNPEGRLNITLLACSNGAETYTIASWLRRSCPDLDFHIHASDLHQAMIDRAESAEYSKDEVLHSVYMTKEFLNDTFSLENDRYKVRPEIRKHVSFSQASLLDGDELREKFGQAPLVIAQNVLFHLTPEDTSTAMANLVSLMEPRAALLIEGMQLDLRIDLTKKYNLTPFTQNLRMIYEETRVHTPPHWWRVYWGTEPYIPFRKDIKRRYSTAFMRDENTSID